VSFFIFKSEEALILELDFWVGLFFVALPWVPVLADNGDKREILRRVMRSDFIIWYSENSEAKTKLRGVS
jgi:hypothetical protein